jgi:hypothetical protein
MGLHLVEVLVHQHHEEVTVALISKKQNAAIVQPQCGSRFVEYNKIVIVTLFKILMGREHTNFCIWHKVSHGPELMGLSKGISTHPTNGRYVSLDAQRGPHYLK